MNIIDTHSHIYLPEFAGDRVEMLKRARGKGISRIMLPAIDRSTHSLMLTLEKDEPVLCPAMMGVHPCSVKENYEDELEAAGKYLEQRSFIAIGETGLDFYWDKTFTAEQYVAFNRQIGWAIDHAIPVVIHSREAIDECIEVIRERQKGNLTGVFHCFSGNELQAQKIIDLGFYLGIGGVVTFKNSGLDKVMKTTGLERVVLETDAPYLAPVPFRGKRNEPSYLDYVLEKMATIHEISKEEIARITTLNAEKLFGIKQPLL